MCSQNFEKQNTCLEVFRFCMQYTYWFALILHQMVFLNLPFIWYYIQIANKYDEMQWNLYLIQIKWRNIEWRNIKNTIREHCLWHCNSYLTYHSMNEFQWIFLWLVHTEVVYTIWGLYTEALSSSSKSPKLCTTPKNVPLKFSYKGYYICTSCLRKGTLGHMHCKVIRGSWKKMERSLLLSMF